MVQQLQANPSDSALRERIIQTARQLDPAPAIPQEARDYFIRGSTIAKVATDAAGQKLAVDNFEKALRVAPWWGDAWYNLAVAQELAGDLDSATASLRLYIETGVSEKERQDALDRISIIAAKTELASRAQATRDAQAKQKAERQAAIQKLAGTWYGKWCGVGDATGACTDTEARGSNWWSVLEPVGDAGTRPAPITFEFPESGVVRIRGADWTAGCRPAGNVWGFAQGPSLSDVRWEFRGDDGATRPIWIDVNSEGSYLRLSCDRPLAGAGSNVQYHYMSYARQP
jgi:hypothetical protein